MHECNTKFNKTFYTKMVFSFCLNGNINYITHRALIFINELQIKY